MRRRTRRARAHRQQGLTLSMITLYQLQYLELTYPAPALYPQDTTERTEVARWMLWLDSTLGLAARRLAYTQIALEQPGLLAELFLPRSVVRGDAGKFKVKLAGAVIAGVLTR